MKIMRIQVRRYSSPFSIYAGRNDIKRVITAAVSLFGGDRQAAIQWMYSPTKGLGMIAPICLMASENETLQVLKLIGRLEHGVFS